MNEYIKELKILRTEITVIKNIINGFRHFSGSQFNVEYEYELDEEGKVKLDKDGNPILKLDENGYPIVKNTSGKFTRLILDTFANYLNIAYAKDDKGQIINDVEGYPIIGTTVLDEDGKVTYDENGKPIINQTYVGNVITFLIKEFKDYLQIEKLKNDKGELILDEDGKDSINEESLGRVPNYLLRKINEYFNIEYIVNGEETEVNEETLGRISKFIFDELIKRLGVPDGELPVYINESFDARFKIEDESDGTVIVLLKANHVAIIEQLEKLYTDLIAKLAEIQGYIVTIYSAINNVNIACSTISSKLDAMDTKLDSIQSFASNAEDWAYNAWDNANSANSKCGTIETVVNRIETIVNTINSKLPSS